MAAAALRRRAAALLLLLASLPARLSALRFSDDAEARAFADGGGGGGAAVFEGAAGGLEPGSLANSSGGEGRGVEEDWLIGGRYACCCRAEKPAKCKYRLVAVAAKKHRCCKLRADWCPTLSRYDAVYAARCWDGGAQDLQAHPAYKLVDPETAKPTRHTSQEAAAVPAPISAETVEGKRVRVYLAQERTTEEPLTLARAASDGVAAAMKQACDGAQETWDRVAAYLRRRAAAAGGAVQADVRPAYHLARCHEFDNAMKLLVMRYPGAEAIEALPWTTSEDLLSLLKQVFLGLSALTLVEPAQVHRDLRWGTVAVDARRCLRLTGFGQAASADVPGPVKYVTAYTAPECRGRRCWTVPSMDAYSAGVMAAVALCGAPEYFIFDGFKNDLAAMTSEVEGYMRQEGRTQLGALYTYGMRRARKAILGMSMKEQVEYLKARPVDSEFLLRAPFEDKLRFCDQAANGIHYGRLDIIDQLLSSEPTARPTPQAVLASSLFRDVQAPYDCEAKEGRFKAWGVEARPQKMTIQLLAGDGAEQEVEPPVEEKAAEYVDGLGEDFVSKSNPAVLEGYHKMMQDVAGWKEGDIRCLMYKVMERLQRAVPFEKKAKFFKFNLNYFHPDKAPADRPEIHEACGIAFSEVKAFDQDTFRYMGRSSPCKK